MTEVTNVLCKVFLFSKSYKVVQTLSVYNKFTLVLSLVNVLFTQVVHYNLGDPVSNLELIRLWKLLQSVPESAW